MFFLFRPHLNPLSHVKKKIRSKNNKHAHTKSHFSLPGQSNVFIHVEGDDVLEGELASLVELDEVSVNTDGGGAGGETQDEGLGSSGSELLDAFLDVLGCTCIISFGENKKKMRVSQEIQAWKPLSHHICICDICWVKEE